MNLIQRIGTTAAVTLLFQLLAIITSYATYLASGEPFPFNIDTGWNSLDKFVLAAHYFVWAGISFSIVNYFFKLDRIDITLITGIMFLLQALPMLIAVYRPDFLFPGGERLEGAMLELVKQDAITTSFVLAVSVAISMMLCLYIAPRKSNDPSATA